MFSEFRLLRKILIEFNNILIFNLFVVGMCKLNCSIFLVLVFKIMFFVKYVGVN